MANISTYLENILKAVYGKDVRQSIHDGIEKINEDVESNIEAEAGRVQAENQRSQAENTRQLAEQEREDFASDLEQKVETGYFKGDKGEGGISAYEVAANQGFIGTEEEWLQSLKGEKGDKGEDGQIDSTSTIEFEDYTAETPPNPQTALIKIISSTSIGDLLSNIKAFLMNAITKSDIVNNFATTDPTMAAAAPLAKELKEDVIGLNKSLTNKFDKANIVNNYTTTLAGFALDARAGKALKDYSDAIVVSKQDISTAINTSNIRNQHVNSSDGVMSRNQGHSVTFEWNVNSQLEIYVDGTLVRTIAGFGSIL